MAGANTYLIGILPRNGFVYSSRPRVLLNDQRDSQVLRGLVQVTGRTFLQRSDRARVDRVLALVFDHLSANPPTDDVIGWLDNVRAGAIGRPASRIALAAAVPLPAWRDLIVSLVRAQATWESETSPAIKASQVNHLNALWHSVKRFRDITQAVWDSDARAIGATTNPHAFSPGP